MEVITALAAVQAMLDDAADARDACADWLATLDMALVHRAFEEHEASTRQSDVPPPPPKPVEDGGEEEGSSEEEDSSEEEGDGDVSGLIDDGEDEGEGGGGGYWDDDSGASDDEREVASSLTNLKAKGMLWDCRNCTLQNYPSAASAGTACAGCGCGWVPPEVTAADLRAGRKWTAQVRGARVVKFTGLTQNLQVDPAVSLKIPMRALELTHILG